MKPKNLKLQHIPTVSNNYSTHQYSNTYTLKHSNSLIL